MIHKVKDPEFARCTMQDWAERNHVELRFSSPASRCRTPTESFNSWFRDESCRSTAAHKGLRSGALVLLQPAGWITTPAA